MNVPNRITRNLSQEVAIRTVALVEDGQTQRYMGNFLGVDRSTISRLMQKKVSCYWKRE